METSLGLRRTSQEKWVDIPMEPLRAFQTGKIADVPIVVGTVTDEALEFVYAGFGSPLGVLEYNAVVDLVFGVRNSAKIAKQYPVPANTTDYRDHLTLFANDALFHCAARNATLSISKLLSLAMLGK